MNHDDIHQRLIDGNTRYQQDLGHGKLRDASRRQALSSGQAPWAIVLSCADSRVTPEFVFDTGMGELFVVRVAGNVASPEVIASIEFAVKVLGTSYILVLGHESCGAVGGAVQEVELSDHFAQLARRLEPAVSATTPPDETEVTRAHAIHTAQELAAKSSILAMAVDAGDLVIRPAYYHLDGRAEFL